MDKAICRRRNDVERTINGIENSMTVATGYDECAYVFHGTAAVASIRVRP
ncbi:hypothetical protein ACWDXD_23330 [Streptomyces sp. NPDC003314]